MNNEEPQEAIAKAIIPICYAVFGIVVFFIIAFAVPNPTWQPMTFLLVYLAFGVVLIGVSFARKLTGAKQVKVSEKQEQTHRQSRAESLAQNTTVRREIRNALDSKDAKIRAAAATNENTPSEMLAKYFNIELSTEGLPDTDVLTAFVRNPNFDVEIIHSWIDEMNANSDFSLLLEDIDLRDDILARPDLDKDHHDLVKQYA